MSSLNLKERWRLRASQGFSTSSDVEAFKLMRYRR